jgi:hypothetical protein
MVFHVRQTIVKSPDVVKDSSDDDNEGGCFSSIAVGAAAVVMALAGAWMIRRKQDV